MPLLTQFIKRLIEGSRKDVFTCCLREVGPDQLGSLLLIALLRDVTCKKKKKKRERRLLLVFFLLFNGAKQQNGMAGTTEECNGGRANQRRHSWKRRWMFFICGWNTKQSWRKKWLIILCLLILCAQPGTDGGGWARINLKPKVLQMCRFPPFLRRERHETCWLASLQNNWGRRLRWCREVSNVAHSASDSNSSHKTDSLQYAAATRERRNGRVRHTRSQESFWREKARE